MLHANVNNPPGPTSASAAWWCRRGWPLALILALCVSSAARAEATVVVEVKRSDGTLAEGVVQLTQGATKLRCTTSKGRCEIKGVAGGTYSVEVEQAGRPASKPKTVMIPPSGEVKLIVAAS